MSDPGRLIVSQHPSGTLIDGIVNASPDLMAIVGTVKEASAPVVNDISELERAIVEAAQSGKKVMDGYIKFAHPIRFNHPTHVGVTKQASNDAATLDDNGLMDFIEKLSQLESVDDDEGLTKLAACSFVDNMINQIELDKVDGKEVGLMAPVKVAFKDDKTKDWFLSLFNKKAEIGKSAADNLVERLVSLGLDKSADFDRLLKKLEKRSGR